MSILLTVTQTRPNSSVSWFHETDQYRDLVKNIAYTRHVELVETGLSSGTHQLSDDGLTLITKLQHVDWAAQEKSYNMDGFTDIARMPYEKLQGITTSFVFEATPWTGVISWTDVFTFVEQSALDQFVAEITPVWAGVPPTIDGLTVKFVTVLSSAAEVTYHINNSLGKCVEQLHYFNGKNQIKIEPV
jgi:hypothetical protein